MVLESKTENINTFLLIDTTTADRSVGYRQTQACMLSRLRITRSARRQLAFRFRHSFYKTADTALLSCSQCESPCKLSFILLTLPIIFGRLSYWFDIELSLLCPKEAPIIFEYSFFTSLIIHRACVHAE